MNRRYLDTINTIKQFKFKSVFFLFYLLLILFSMLFIGIFSAYIYHIYFQNFSKTQELTLNSYLSQISEKLDNSLYFLNDSVITLSRNDRVVNAIIVPKDTDIERNAQIVSFLRATVENSAYIDYVCLYEATNQLLLTSRYALQPSTDSYYTDVLTYCLDESNWTLLNYEKNRYSSGLVVYQDKIFLTHGFISGNGAFLGVLVAQVNRERLFSQLGQTVADTPYTVEIQTAQSDPLFTSRSPLDFGRGKVTLRSDYSEWNYILSYPQPMNISVGTYFKSILPFLLILLAVGLICSFLIAQQFYRPINQLFLSVSRNRPPSKGDAALCKGAAGSEVEMLTMTYRQMQSDQKAAQDFIIQARPELESNLLLDLIAGKASQEDDLEQQLKAMQSSLISGGTYQCFIMKSTHTVESGNLVNYIFFKQVQSILQKIIRLDWGMLYFLRPENDTDTFVLQYADGLSSTKINQIKKQFLSDAQRQLHSVSEGILLSWGDVCVTLENLCHSYSEAKETLRKTLYYAAENVGESTPSASGEDSNDSQEAYFISQTELFSSCLCKHDLVMAETLLTQILKDVCVSSNELALIRKVCARILDLLVERTLDTPADSTGRNQTGSASMFRQLDSLSDPKKIYLFMLEETSCLLDSIKKGLKSRQLRLIIQAKEYMQQNYSDSNLSIRQIADAIGISETYLSSIFTEYTKENLITYLNTYRIRIAKDLLIKTRIMIKEIGYKAGFNTVQNFNRVFKKIVGITPGDYRKQYKLADDQDTGDL
ncbi:helix-turn-helix domain-containing protein [Oscillibacter sp.]|uniref:helix-turn-helix domain-containing protein n=1 Tax=Oscillibacter sp. TaxID=1945593 RepID=UPI0026214218|nr:helix-turn-helix domain-containing protein [Oscillibacter sp.]MDD3347163.1 helix-turn-helix domain-containing protein [Oscillibacter sp.]